MMPQPDDSEYIGGHMRRCATVVPGYGAVTKVEHGFGTLDVFVTVYDASPPYEERFVVVRHLDPDTIEIDSRILLIDAEGRLGSMPVAGPLRVVVLA